MQHKSILLGVGLIIIGLLWFYFSLINYKKLKRKIYKPNKEEAKEWPYIKDLEGIGDYSMRVLLLQNIAASLLTILFGFCKIYYGIKT